MFISLLFYSLLHTVVICIDVFPSIYSDDFLETTILSGFPGGSVVKNLPANAGDVDLIPGLGRFTGEGTGSPF